MRNPLDDIRQMVGNDKVSSRKLEDALMDLDVDNVEQWASAVEEMASALRTVAENFEDWQNAEGRDEKADARDNLLESMDTVIACEGSIDMLDPVLPLRLGGSVDERLMLLGIAPVSKRSDVPWDGLLAIALGLAHDDDLQMEMIEAGRKESRKLS